MSFKKSKFRGAKKSQEDDEQQVIADPVVESFSRLESLLKSFEDQTSDWAFELQTEVNSNAKKEILENIHVHEEDGEFLKSLAIAGIDRGQSAADYETPASDARDGNLDPYRLDSDLMSVMNNLEVAKLKSEKRLDKVQNSFRRLKNAQESVLDQATRRILVETGLTKAEKRVAEYQNQVEKLKSSLEKKNRLIDLNDREKELSAEELRHKYELDTEDRVRSLLISVDGKKKDLAKLADDQQRICTETEALKEDLKMLLKDIDGEEKTKEMEAATASLASKNPVQQFREAIFACRSAETSTEKASDPNFTDGFDGLITSNLVRDAQHLMRNTFEKQKKLFRSMNATEDRLVRQRQAIASLQKGEEFKALGRLKKATTTLEAKVDSDQKRIKVMETLLQQLQDKQQEEDAGIGNVRKTILSQASDFTTARGYRRRGSGSHSDTGSSSGSGYSTSSSDYAEMAHSDMYPLPFDFINGAESLTMTLHRKLYTRYYEDSGLPIAKHRGGSSRRQGGEQGGGHGGTGINNRMEQQVRKKKSDLALPRKRRITAKQAANIQSIINMMMKEVDYLSSVNAKSINHILLMHRDNDDDDAVENIVDEAGDDHVNHLVKHSSNSNAGEISELGSGVSSSMIANDSNTTSEIDVGGDSKRVLVVPSSHAAQNSSRFSSSYKSSSSRRMSKKYLDPGRALQEEADKESYAQNYGIKLAIEQLNAMMEALTNGASSELESGGSLKRVKFSRTEQEEKMNVEALRQEINMYIKMIRNLHYRGLDAKKMRNSVRKEVDHQLAECDRLRNDLLGEIEGSHWPAMIKAGQYELEIEALKAKLKELRKVLRSWDSKVSSRRMKNIKLGQLIARDTRHRQFLARQAAAAAAAAAIPVTADPSSSNSLHHQSSQLSDIRSDNSRSQAVLDAASTSVDYRYSVANKRVVLFDDMANIYHNAMTQIRSLDNAIPYAVEERNGSISEPPINEENDGSKVVSAAGTREENGVIGEAHPKLLDGEIAFDGSEKINSDEGQHMLQNAGEQENREADRNAYDNFEEELLKWEDHGLSNEFQFEAARSNTQNDRYESATGYEGDQSDQDEDID